MQGKKKLTLPMVEARRVHTAEMRTQLTMDELCLLVLYRAIQARERARHQRNIMRGADGRLIAAIDWNHVDKGQLTAATLFGVNFDMNGGVLK